MRRFHGPLSWFLLAGGMILAPGCGGGGAAADTTSSTVQTPVKPAILTDLAPTTQAVAGAEVTLTVQANGTPAPTFQWRRNGQPLDDQTGSSCTLKAVKTTDDGATFDVVATNAAGSATSKATTLRVQSTAGAYAVTFSTTKAGTLSGAVSQTIPEGGSTTAVSATPVSGATFAGWTGSNGFTSQDNPLVLTNVRASMTLQANYTGVKIGCMATDISGVDSTGAKVKLSDFKGSVIVLDLSAQWCGPCNNDAVPLEQLYQTYKGQGLKMVTVLTQDNFGRTPTVATLQSWVAKGLTYRVMNDTTGSSPSTGVAETVYVHAFGGYPTVVVIDKQFTIQYFSGYSASSIEAKVKALLAL